MIRSLKILGLMAVAALAMSAMLASAAQAEPKGVFTVGETKSPTNTEKESHTASNVIGHQYGTTGIDSDNLFEAIPGSEEVVTCDTSTFDVTDNDGADDGTAKTLTVHPTYTHCTANGLPATVNTDPCDYSFEQPTNIGTNEYTGTAELHCEAGKSIEVTVFLFGGVTSHSVDVCTIKVHPAEGTTDTLDGHVIYKNGINEMTEDVHDVTVNATIGGITWEQEGSCGADSGNEAIYKNKVTVSAFDEEEEKHDDVWISDES